MISPVTPLAIYDACFTINELKLLSLQKTYCSFEVDGVFEGHSVLVRAELGLGREYVNLVDVQKDGV